MPKAVISNTHAYYDHWRRRLAILPNRWVHETCNLTALNEHAETVASGV